MSELIDREATVEQICKIGEMVGGHDRDVVISIALFVQDDKTAFPTVERPHGEWVWNTDNHNQIRYCKCSICGVGMGDTEYDFCPNCGADMREGDPD